MKKYILWQAATFIAACAIVLWLMPRDYSAKFHYEENRPWSYGILTAPFDITVYRDSATIAAMTDSIDRETVPIFRRDPAPAARAEAAVTAASHISPSVRSRLAATIRRIYADGVVDPPTAALIASDRLPEIKINDNNVNTQVATERMRSQRDAYALVDSLFRDSPARPAIQTIELGKLLEPNITPDAKATERYREALLQPVLAGIGVIQQGERIIDQGEIVTPQLYQILKTYEATLDKTARASHSKMLNTFFGQLIYVALTFGLVYGFLCLYYTHTFLDPKKVLALMTLPVAFFIFSVFMAKAFTAGVYIVPLAIVPLVVMVFYDTRTAFFILVATTLLCAAAASFPLEFIFLELTAGAAVLFSLKELSRRSELLRSALVAFAAYVCSYLAVELMSTGTVGSLSWRLIGYFAVNAVLISFAYILIFIYEKLFGMVSVVTLVELSDITNPLMRALSTECPGTFQHSMAVSNLASEAAHRIGA
ncbi:MAG: hydrolase, partial [Muribaculaceae bacterium]|nr:hydrolase [Muribaculaceae bacterium]